jgi:uncharacterized protein YecE (DUF72 family)
MKDAGMLAHYSSKFPTVEINNTFYRLPKEEVLQGWASQTPASFMFAIKASQRITHYGRLKPESASALEFLLKNTACLGDKLGPVLFQLPPNMKKDVPRLRTFLATLPSDRKFTVEFRHESWFDDETYDALRERDIPMCVIEQPDFSSPIISTASWGYVRLHRFDYDPTMLAAWSEKIAAQSWSQAFVFFKHDEGAGSGPPAVGAFLDVINPRLG